MTSKVLIEAAETDGCGIVLDARAEEAFQEATYPGAIHVPVATWEREARTAAGSLEAPGFWAARIGALGIDGACPVAVFDNGRMTEAARIWFILQHFGVEAAVVNGGWPHLASFLGAHAQPGGGAPEPSIFVPRVGGLVALVTKESLRREIGTATQILDARTLAEFTDEDRCNNPRGGHLPGARHLAHADLLDGTGRLYDRATLVAFLTRAGLGVGAPVVTHCQGGGRAALAALAAIEAGLNEVGVYYLSFAEWAQDEACPVKLTESAGQ